MFIFVMRVQSLVEQGILIFEASRSRLFRHNTLSMTSLDE